MQKRTEPAAATAEPDYEPKKASFAQNAVLTVKIIAILGVVLVLLWLAGTKG